MATKKQTGKAKRLVLLDSHAILHRAYHALPDFSTARGEPTGALYGLITMLLKTLADLKPDYLAACRDLPGPTHRHEAYEAYKATRVKTEDALVAQLEKAPEVFKAFGIPLYQAPGYEADDLLGTIVKQVAAQKDIETIIASGDLDTLQLVSGDRVRVYTLRQGLNDTVLYDEEKVRERFGFGPEHIPDYKGLRGDPSDNIKGVAGIGEKTATDLVKAFGSVEGLYATVKKDPAALEAAGFRPRVAKLVADGQDDAMFSKQLATIHADAPVSFEVPDRPWRLADHASAIMDLCDNLEFKSLKERVRALTKTAETAGDAEASPVRRVDSRALAETAIALWLVRSDLTSPTLDDILRFAKTEDFEEARAAVFKALHGAGKSSQVYETIERPLIPIIERMNETGVALDTQYLGELAREYRGELERIAARIYAHAGRKFNIASPKQLAEILFDELKLSPPRQKLTATGARTTKEEELAKLRDQHPIVDDILSYRELAKLLSTYVEKLPEMVGTDGRLHAQFLQAGTTTGRMASQDPNLQNIPIKTEYGKRIRRAFVASKGCVLVALDYSQIELRLAAGLSGDEKLAEVFRRGGDVHTAVASQVFNVPPELVDHEMRRRAKVINFGILYGMGVNALRANLGEKVSRDEAARFLDEYFASFSGLAQYITLTKKSAAQRGYTETLFGRRRYFSGFDSPLPQVKAQAERMAVNAPIQGTQADIIKLAMIRADALIEEKGWRPEARLVLQIHDELIYEISADAALEIARAIKQVMETVVPAQELCGVPIVAEVAWGPHWGDMKRL